MKTLHIHGRRWFQRTYGNTYHTATIYVDGEFSHKTGITYGYGDQYLQTARQWLKDNGHLFGIQEKKGTPGESLWRFCERTGVKFVYDVDDVTRKKDL